jgi:hypothetical protein
VISVQAIVESVVASQPRPNHRSLKSLNRFFGQPLRDAIYYSHRTQILTTTPRSPAETVFRKFGETPVRNAVEMVAMLTAPATLQIEIAGHRVSRAVPAGLRILETNAVLGRPVFRIERAGKTIVEKASDWEIVDNAEFENPVYFGGSSTRAFVKLPRPSERWR